MRYAVPNPKVSISGTLQISGCLRTISENTMGNELQKKDWIAKNICFVHMSPQIDVQIRKRKTFNVCLMMRRKWKH